MQIPRYADADAKDPRDITTYTFSLAGALTVPGDAIVGVPVVSVALPGLTISGVSVTNNVVAFFTTGGFDGVDYRINFAAVSTYAPAINRSVILPVRTR